MPFFKFKSGTTTFKYGKIHIIHNIMYYYSLKKVIDAYV